MEKEYRVNLDIYNGPMDLLLYLIRRDEVDIHDIPIAQITQQYLSYVEVIKRLDPNLVGDFLVIAATLMEIKTRMLLPAPEVSEEGEEVSELDPRSELVRQLLEYKAFKDAASDLRDAYERQSQRHPRGQTAELPSREKEVDLEDVQVWDLLDAFNNLMAAIGADARQHEVVYDDTPVELHAADIMDRLVREGPMTFSKIFEGRKSQIEIVGLFLAMLELVRQKKIRTVQNENFEEIHIQINPDAPQYDDENFVRDFTEREHENEAAHAKQKEDSEYESSRDHDGEYVSEESQDEDWSGEFGEEDEDDDGDDENSTVGR